MIKTGIIGAWSDVAATLIKILLRHPDVELQWVCAAEHGQRLDEIYLQLFGDTELTVVDKPDWDVVDLVFIAENDHITPEEIGQHLDNPELHIIDFTENYMKPDEEHLFTYGLCELNRKYIVNDCRHIVCPGVVPHILEVALLPLAKNLMLGSDIHATVVVGNTATNLGAPAAVNYRANSMAREVRWLLEQVQTSFNREIHLAVIDSNAFDGTLATITVDTNTDLDVLTSLYNDYFDDHNFTYIVDRQPTPRDVLGTNKCLIHLMRDNRQLHITAAFDNRLKGTAANAVHNMNLLFGLHEQVGLMAF